MKNIFANTKKDLFSYRWKLHGVIKCHAEIIIKAYIYSNKTMWMCYLVQWKRTFVYYMAVYASNHGSMYYCIGYVSAQLGADLQTKSPTQTELKWKFVSSALFIGWFGGMDWKWNYTPWKVVTLDVVWTFSGKKFLVSGRNCAMKLHWGVEI